ncbi:MAG: tetratricopeptide repeat protein [Planctomycetota bacterium]|jgi:outer membrane protein assembly factor BamD (BamD/ComL family)
MGLAISSIYLGYEDAAKEYVDKLVTDFAKDKRMGTAACILADEYRKLARHRKARELYQYALVNWPDAEYTLWSHMGLAISNIHLRYEDAAQDHADKLLTDFAEDKRMARAACLIADEYRKVGKRHEARRLYRYVVDNQADAEYALWSQMGMAILTVSTGNDELAKEAIDKLQAAFSEDKRMATAACILADEYRELARHRKARELYQYALVNWPDAEYTLWSHMGLAISNIHLGYEDAAQDHADRLLTGFAEDKRMARAACLIADEYRKVGKHDKARGLYRYVVDNRPDADYALWSQMGLAILSVWMGNDELAEEAIDKLQATFSEDERIATAACLIADEYRKMEKHDRACGLYRYVVDNWPDAEYALWSQMGLAISNIRVGDDSAAQVAIEELAAKFSGRERINQAVHDIVREYRQMQKYEKADQVYQYIRNTLDKPPQADPIIWSRAAQLASNIALGNETNPQAAVDKLITDFGDDPNLPQAVFRVGQKYYSQARLHQGQGHDDRANEYYRKAIAVWERIAQELVPSPTTPQAYWCSAVVYSQELREYEKGIQYYQEIVDNWPDYTYAWHAQFFVGKYYEMLRDAGDLSESEASPKIEQAYESFVEKYPGSEYARHVALKMGRLSLRRERWAAAAQYFEFLCDKYPEERGQLLLDLGLAYEKLGELDMAAQLYTEFIQTADPSNPRIETVTEKLRDLKE